MANWKYTLKFKDTFVEDPDNLNQYGIEVLTNEMAGRIDSFIKTIKDNDLINDLESISESLRTCDDIESIDYVLSDMYDICDEYRVWVK